MSARPGATIAGIALLLASIIAPAQSDKPKSDDLLARVSYQSTYMMYSSDQESPRICFALYRSGRYQLLKIAKGTAAVLEGTLSQDELDSMSKMLNSLDPEKSNKGGMIQKGSESLVAQVVRKDGTDHYAWIDPDHRRPFPPAALSIVNWLQNFKAQGASPLTMREMSDLSICPAPSAMPVPAVAIVKTPPAGPQGITGSTRCDGIAGEQ